MAQLYLVPGSSILQAFLLVTDRTGLSALCILWLWLAVVSIHTKLREAGQAGRQGRQVDIEIGVCLWERFEMSS